MCCLAFKYHSKTARSIGGDTASSSSDYLGNKLNCETFAIMYDIPLFADRSDRQMRQLFTSMHDLSHCLHRLLLENFVESTIHTLHNYKNYGIPFARTSRFENLFLVHCLQNFHSMTIFNYIVEHIFSSKYRWNKSFF